MSVAAKKADEAIAQITQSASKAEGGLRNMAGASIVLEAGIKSIQTLQGVIGGAISQYNSFDTAMRRANTMALAVGRGIRQDARSDRQYEPGDPAGAR